MFLLLSAARAATPARPAFSESFSVDTVEVDDTLNGEVVLTQVLRRDSTTQEHRSFMSANGSLVGGGEEQVMRCDLHPLGWLIVAGGADASNLSSWSCSNQTVDSDPQHCQWGQFWTPLPLNASYAGQELVDGRQAHRWSYWMANEQWALWASLDGKSPVATGKVWTAHKNYHLWRILWRNFVPGPPPLSRFDVTPGIRCGPAPPPAPPPVPFAPAADCQPSCGTDALCCQDPQAPPPGVCFRVKNCSELPGSVAAPRMPLTLDQLHAAAETRARRHSRAVPARPRTTTWKSSASRATVHLFATDALVSDRAGFTLQVSNVTKAAQNPLLREGDRPWEVAWWNTYPSVAWDGRRYQLWYNGFANCRGSSPMCPASNYPGAAPVTDRGYQWAVTFYAESTDGYDWERPSLGQVAWPNETSPATNNIAIDHGATDPNVNVMYDAHERDASRRYKAIGLFQTFANASTPHGSKVGIVTSADGRRWTGYVPIDSLQVTADTSNNLHYDPELQQYLIFSRRNTHDANSSRFGMRREVRANATSVAGPWPRATECAHGEAGDELYALEPWRHDAWAAGVYLAVGMYYADTAPAERVYCELLSSSDHGRSWTRLAPKVPFIPPGDDGQFDSHTCFAANPIPDAADSELMRYYYAGGNGPHSGPRSDFIALATAPSHATVGLRVAANGVASTITTRPIRVERGGVFLAAVATSAMARVDVEVLDAQTERPIAAGRLDAAAMTAEPSVPRRHALQLTSMGDAAGSAEVEAGDQAVGLRVGHRIRLRVTAVDAVLFAVEV